MPVNNLPLQVGVKIFLKNSADKYLLLHRSAEKYPEVKNAWDIVGGRISPGTPLMQNLRREIKEETGLEFSADNPQLIAAQDINTPSKHVVRLTYLGETDGLPILGDEHDQYQWYTVDEMRELPQLDDFVRDLLDRLPKS